MTDNLVLIVVAGPVKGRKVQIPPGRKVVLGRKDGVGLTLNDKSLSRKHCTVDHVRPGYATVHDLGSKNGTFVEKKRVVKSDVLTDGCHIRIGATVIKVLLPDTPTEMEADDRESDMSRAITPVDMSAIDIGQIENNVNGIQEVAAENASPQVGGSGYEASAQSVLMYQHMNEELRQPLPKDGFDSGVDIQKSAAARCAVCGEPVPLVDILTGVATKKDELHICGSCVEKGETIESVQQRLLQASNQSEWVGDDGDTEHTDSAKGNIPDRKSQQTADRMRAELQKQLGSDHSSEDEDEDEDEYEYEYSYVEVAEGEDYDGDDVEVIEEIVEIEDGSDSVELDAPDDSTSDSPPVEGDIPDIELSDDYLPPLDASPPVVETYPSESESESLEQDRDAEPNEPLMDLISRTVDFGLEPVHESEPPSAPNPGKRVRRTP